MLNPKSIVKIIRPRRPVRIVLNPNFSFLFVPKLTLTTLEGIGEIMPGQSIADVITDALASNALLLRAGDVVVICQKIVSKAENRYVELATVTPSDRANELADLCHKDPRLVELVLRESSGVLRCVKDVLIVRHRLGFIVANAGIAIQVPPRFALRLRSASASVSALSLAIVLAVPGDWACAAQQSVAQA